MRPAPPARGAPLRSPLPDLARRLLLTRPSKLTTPGAAAATARTRMHLSIAAPIQRYLREATRSSLMAPQGGLSLKECTISTPGTLMAAAFAIGTKTVRILTQRCKQPWVPRCGPNPDLGLTILPIYFAGGKIP